MGPMSTFLLRPYLSNHIIIETWYLYQTFTDCLYYQLICMYYSKVPKHLHLRRCHLIFAILHNFEPILTIQKYSYLLLIQFCRTKYIGNEFWLDNIKIARSESLTMLQKCDSCFSSAVSENQISIFYGCNV